MVLCEDKGFERVRLFEARMNRMFGGLLLARVALILWVDEFIGYSWKREK